MKLLDNYIEAQEKLLEYFGCDDGSKDISDSREYFWQIDGEQVNFSEEMPDADSEDFEWTYCSEIYGGRRQNRNVFRKEGFTMVLLISGFGDGEYFAIFDNGKEIKE